MDIYDYIDDDCQSEHLVVPGFVKMMINKWTTLESKDEIKKTPTRIVRSDTRQAKHSTRSTFRSCSPNRGFNQNLGLIPNGNGHPLYIVNGTSIHSNYIQKDDQSYKGQNLTYDNRFQQIGTLNSGQREGKSQPSNCERNYIKNGINSSSSIINSNSLSQISSSNIKLPSSINTKNLNFINNDLNGNAINKEPNCFLQDTKKLSKSAKENALRDKFFVNHASIKFAPKDNNEILINRASVNGFDSKKPKVIIYEEEESHKLKENLDSMHHNTPEPLILQNTVIVEDFLHEKQNIMADEAESDKKNGLFYLNVMEYSKNALKSKCMKYENLEDNVPEEVSGRIRSLIGNTHLLTRKKFVQFEQLCQSNIKNVANEPNVTNEDLAGFWDLILIQIQSIEDSFKELDRLKDNGWKDLEEAPINKKSSPKKLSIRSTRKTKSENFYLPKKSTENPEKTEERKKLNEEKQKLRQTIIDGRTQRKNSSNDDSEVQIFTK